FGLDRSLGQLRVLHGEDRGAVGLLNLARHHLERLSRLDVVLAVEVLHRAAVPVRQIETDIFGQPIDAALTLVERIPKRFVANPNGADNPNAGNNDLPGFTHVLLTDSPVNGWGSADEPAEGLSIVTSARPG